MLYQKVFNVLQEGNLVCKLPARCPLLTVLVNIAERATDVNDFDVPKICVYVPSILLLIDQSGIVLLCFCGCTTTSSTP